MPKLLDVDAVSDILRTAGRLGLELQPTDLPDSAYYLYEAIYDSLIPRLNLKEPQRRFIALDTAIELCAEISGTHITPTVSLQGKPGNNTVEKIIVRCFKAHGLARDCYHVPHTLSILSLYCRGGIMVPTLRHMAGRLRDEQIRHNYHHEWGIDYATLAHRYGLSQRQVRRILKPANGAANGSTQGKPK